MHAPLYTLALITYCSATNLHHGKPAHQRRQLESKKEDQTPFVRLTHPEFMGPARVRYASPDRARPISALVLSEMSSDPNSAHPLTPELIVNAAPHIPLPALGTFASVRKFTNASTTASAPDSYTTSSVSYTHSRDGQRYVTEIVINDVTLRGTFEGQTLPDEPYQPKEEGSTSYAELVGDSFWFYEQQRSGLLPQPRRAPWRNVSTLHDGLDWRIDLTGGYFDAGDYLKFTHPLSAALAYLTYGCTEQWKGIEQAGQSIYLDQTLRWGFDWLIKAHPAPDHLFVQVGDTDTDNDYWGGDATVPEPRPAYMITMDKPGTDVAAGTAAAFAAGAVIYSSLLNDETYAEKLLTHAGSLYYFAERAPKALYQRSIPASASAYASSDYGDELVLAGLMMFKATSEPYYLERAAEYASHYSLGDQAIGLPIDWDSKHALALLIGAQLASTGANISYDYTGSLDRYVDSLLTAHTTSTGLLWFSGSSDEASLVAAINSAYLLTAYADLFPSSSRSTDALSLACKQLDYVLGSNPKGTIYITGVSPAHSPKNPQSAMASGGSPDGDIDTEPLKEKYRLFGAMVGGPDEQDRFKDQRSNYRQSEVALDYNALLTPLFAREVKDGGVPFFARQQGRRSRGG